MNNKTIIILAAVIGIGAYFYFNNKKQPVSNGANTGGGGTSPGGPGPVGPVTVTDTGDDGTETGTGTTDDTGTDTTDGGTTVYPGAPTPNTPTNQEIDTMITACVSVGGTWTTGGCIYSNSPNPRGSQTGSGTTSGNGILIVSTKSGSRLRIEPTTNSQIIKTYDAGVSLVVVGQSSESDGIWYNVQEKSSISSADVKRQGWMRSDVVNVVGMS